MSSFPIESGTGESDSSSCAFSRQPHDSLWTPCFYWHQTLLCWIGYSTGGGGSVYMFSVSLLRNHCSDRVWIFVPYSPNEGHRTYPQPTWCRAYSLQRWPATEVARWHLSSDCTCILFLSVRGITTCFFVPDSGDLVTLSSIDNQDQSMPSRSPQASKPFCKKRAKNLASHHPGDEYIPVAFRAFQWQPVLRTKNMVSMTTRWSTCLR